MIFQCNESIFVSRSVYSVIDSQLRCDLLVFFMDISYGIRMGYFVGLCDVLSDDRVDSRLLMPVGMFFVVIGGWLLAR